MFLGQRKGVGDGKTGRRAKGEGGSIWGGEGLGGAPSAGNARVVGTALSSSFAILFSDFYFELHQTSY